MRLPPPLLAFLERPAVRRWIETGRDIVRQARARVEPLARRIRIKHIATAGVVLLVLAAAIVVDILAGAPSTDQIRTIGNLPVATVVLDRNDEPAFTIFAERRYEVPLDRISPHLVQAVIAIEDQRFYKHAGIDPWRILGSVWANLSSGEIEQGGSTITQQLAKLTFLTPDKTLRRKLREWYLALRIEGAFSKDEILEIYLNKVYFGDGFHGVEAASRGYFGKSASDLSLTEAALLAGIIQRPSAYAPEQYPDRAIARRAVVLRQMAAAGMIDEAAAQQAIDEPLALTDGFVHERTGAYFEQAVTRELVDRFGWETVSQGGLRVYTTYDPIAQAAAEKALTEGLDAIEKRTTFRHARRGEEGTIPVGNESPDYLQGALVAMDPATGGIRALVGGRDFRESQFDRVTQASRQSGSAFKPFVYAAALEQGYSPATLVTDLDRPIATPQGPWLPDDGHSAHLTAMTLRAALRTSSNRAAAHLLQTVGVSHAVDYAHRLGLDAPPVASLVLGTGDVTLLSLTAAYGVFANGGQLAEPFLIRRIEDRSGTVLFEREPHVERVISEATAYQITGMLADVVDRGTGAGARQGGFTRPAAGKTGTTNEYRDAWFVGYTPDLVAGAWVGFDRPRTIVPGGYASELAVPIWGAFMRTVTAGTPARGFERPADVVGVEVCETSGLLPHAACTRARVVNEDGEVTTGRTIVEYFRRGTEPTEYCPIHDTTWYGRVRTTSIEEAALPPSSTISLGGPPPRAPAADEADEAEQPEKVEEERPRRRGFWGRVFGVFRGGADDDNDGEREDRRRDDQRDDERR
jgi:1A family penicillin-binding protein